MTAYIRPQTLSGASTAAPRTAPAPDPFGAPIDPLAPKTTVYRDMAVTEAELPVELAIAAAEISFDNDGSGLEATNVQDALDELDGRVDGAEVDLDDLFDRMGAVEAKTGPATETVAGITELATQDEVNTGAPGGLAVTPATLAARLATLPGAAPATEIDAGIAEIATQAETDAAASVALDDKIITPKKFAPWRDMISAALTDAPNDGNSYARKNAAWAAVTSFPEAPSDGNSYARKNAAWAAITSLTDAPSDGKLYGRQNAAWASIETSGGGSEFEFTFSSATAPPPTAGQLRLNQTNQFLTTTIYVSHTSASGVDVTNKLSFLQVGDKLYLQHKTDATRNLTVTLTVMPFNQGSYHELACSVQSAGSDLLNGATIIASRIVQTPVQATESVAGIAEIATDAETATNDDLRIVTPKKLNTRINAVVGAYVAKAGDTMTGALGIGGAADPAVMLHVKKTGAHAIQWIEALTGGKIPQLVMQGTTQSWAINVHEDFADKRLAIWNNTGTPIEKFRMLPDGTATFFGNVIVSNSAGPIIQLNGPTDSSIYYQSAGVVRANLGWSTANSGWFLNINDAAGAYVRTALLVTATGVGVNGVPGTLLHVMGNSYPNIMVEATNNTNANITLKHGGAAARSWSVYTWAPDGQFLIADNTAAKNRFAISTAGNTTIGWDAVPGTSSLTVVTNDWTTLEVKTTTSAKGAQVMLRTPEYSQPFILRGYNGQFTIYDQNGNQQFWMNNDNTRGYPNGDLWLGGMLRGGANDAGSVRCRAGHNIQFYWAGTALYARIDNATDVLIG